MNACRFVLVVDDDPAMQKVLSLGIKRMGHDVAVARNGREAIDMLGPGGIDPHCVLLDIRMPEMTGREALPRIRKLRPLVPVIMLTAFNDLNNGVECMKDGAFDYLVKPVRLDALSQAISRAFERRDLNSEYEEESRRSREHSDELERESELTRLELEEAYLRLRKSNMETVLALVETIEAKDLYTQGHCVRVRTLCKAMAKAMKMEQAAMEALEYAALLHDIGKIGIPERVLNKPGRLDEAEMEMIKSHPATGAQILSKVAFFKPCVEAVRQHHERWDGKGYPEGRIGPQIDQLARIIAVADSFDAMVVSRPYRAAYSITKAMEEIKGGAGTQYAPEVVQVFLESVPRAGYRDV